MKLSGTTAKLDLLREWIASRLAAEWLVAELEPCFQIYLPTPVPLTLPVHTDARAEAVLRTQDAKGRPGCSRSQGHKVVLSHVHSVCMAGRRLPRECSNSSGQSSKRIVKSALVSLRQSLEQAPHTEL